MKLLLTFLFGFIFGLGLIVSQMTNPDKVLNFLTFNSQWDGSLLIVMAVAMGIMMFAWWFQGKQSRPFLAESFSLAILKTVDRRLIIGAALFGLGWGLSGICPGPGLVQLVSFKAEFWLFFGSLLVGMFITKALQETK